MRSVREENLSVENLGTLAERPLLKASELRAERRRPGNSRGDEGDHD
jgi:hypothetical protein